MRELSSQPARFSLPTGGARVAGWCAGTGRVVDANPPGAYRIEGNSLRAAGRTALGAFGPWAEVIDRAWQLGAQQPEHPVSDGDGAIAAGIGLVDAREAPHQLGVFYLLREYRRNIGAAGFTEARRLMNAGSLAEAKE